MPKLFALLFFLVLLATCRKKDTAPVIPTPPPPYTPIELIDSSFILGNLERNIHDTFYLKFNKPVTVNYIMLLSSTCSPNLEHYLANNGTTVKFTKLLCGSLGGDYRFKFSVKDAKDSTYIDSVSFSYYTRKIPVEGDVMSYLVTPDNKYCWVTTKGPDRIYRLGISDSSKIHYDLPFSPNRFVLNPYNQKLYVLTYYYDVTNRDKLHVINPENGNIEKTVTFKKDQYDDPNKHIVAYDLAFGYNGYGVIRTGTVEYGKTRWRIFDSRLNDSTYAHPEWIASTNGGNYNFNELESCQPNYNKTKIYLKQYNASPRACILDCNTGVLSEYVFPNTYPNHYIVPSKTTDQLFIASYSFQTIVGPGATNNFSEFDNRYSETADFSYRNNEQNIMYYRTNSFSYEFLILDYNQAKTLMKTNVSPNFNKINATTDGKYVIALMNNTLFLFDTEMFYTYI